MSIEKTTIISNSVEIDSQNTSIHETEKNAQESREMATWRRRVVSLALYIGLFLSFMDSTIVATALYTISQDFGALSTTFWVVLSYALAYVSCTTIFARASDFVGRGAAVTATFLFFLVGSLGSGWSPDLNTLIGFRALQGIGGSGLYALSIITLLEISDPSQKPLISGLIGVTVAVAGAAGPLVGGAFTTNVTWRWIFWLNGPLCGVVVFVFVVAWPRDRNPDFKKINLSQIDWVGTILLIAASSLVVFAVQQGADGAASWSSAEVITTLVVGCACWVLLFGWSALINSTSILPALPLFIFKKRALCAGVVTTLLTGFVALIQIYYIPLRFQLVNLQSPTNAGVRLLPFMCFSAVGAFSGGLISSKQNNCFYAFTASAALNVLGLGLMSTLGSSLAIEAKNYGFQALMGMGAGLTYSTVAIMCTFETAPADHAVAQGIAAQARFLGGSLGIAAANGLITRDFRSGSVATAGGLPPAVLSSLLSAGEAGIALDPAQQELVRVAYADAFDQTMRICIYVGIGAIVAALATWQRNPPYHDTDGESRQAKAAAPRSRKRPARASPPWPLGDWTPPPPSPT